MAKWARQLKRLPKIEEMRLWEESIKNELDNLSSYNASNVDVAIEFTEPTAAFNNITTCIKNGIPVVSGTTGWLERRGEVEALCKEKEGAFFYASNYSVGVNIFFKLNEFLAKMMNPYKEYDVEVSEIHHIHKKDAPSGTALTLTEGVLKNIDQKSSWVLEEGESVEAKSEELKIKAFREEEVPGTHSIHFNSEIDSIEITACCT